MSEYPTWLCLQLAIEAMAIEIVSFPSYKMVDLSSSLCGCSPEGNLQEIYLATGRPHYEEMGR